MFKLDSVNVAVSSENRRRYLRIAISPGVLRHLLGPTAIGLLIVAVGLAMPQAANAQTCQPAPVGLVSWWAGDGNTLDSRSRSNGTLTNGATLTAGHVGQAFSFDGNDDAVTMSSSVFHEPFSQLTVEAWVFPLSHGGGVLGRAVVSNTETDGFALRVQNGFVQADLRLTAGDFSTLASTNQLPLNQWSHIAFTYNGSQIKGYMNGTETLSQNATGAVRNSANSNICLLIGNEPTTGCVTQPTQAWHGQIDEPAIYSRALSASEIAAIHAAGTAGKCKPTATVAPSGLVAWYGGDGNANDISGNNLNGTMQLGADFAIGKVGQAFRLSGGTQYVDLGPGFNLDDLTLEAWVFIDPATNVDLRRIISKDNIFPGGTRKIFTLNSSCPPPGTGVDGGGCFAVLIGSSFDAVNAPSAMTSGWHHLAGVRDTSANRFEFYVDGVMVASTTPTVVGAIDSNINTVIGRVSPLAGLEGFQGLVDEAGIFNRALTPEEITSIFNAGIAGKLKTATTPAGANVSTNAGGDATINFSSALTAGTTQQIPLEPAVLPALPLGFTGTGLFYDIATTAGFTGNATVCFNLPSINDEPTFSQLKVLHQESGTWVDRTTGQDFTARTLCSQVSSFSPFAIAGGSTPTSADGTVAGRIRDANGIPIAGVAVRMSGTQSRLTITDAGGNYRFDNVETAGFYTVTPERANFTFSPSQRSFSQLGQHTEAAFTASANGGTLNPLDTTEYLVRQQYVDFLGREPDEAGFNFWVNNIEACGADAQCREVVRINTSAAFFLSIEFQHTGYLAHRLYRSAYGDIPDAPVPVRLAEFRSDSQAIGRGVVVNKIGWEALLENNKQAFTAEFVQRSRFLTAFPASISSAQFVDTLNQNAGNPLAQSERDQLVNDLTMGAKTRAQVLRVVAEDPNLNSAEFNRAFVLMQYFGYLRRNPNDAPELGLNFDGYNFWLNKLNQFNGSFVDAEMVKAFITSREYRQRFGL